MVGYFWNILTLLRWVITAMIIVLLREHPEFQILQLLSISVFAQITIGLKQPYDSKRENTVALINEFLVSAYLEIMLALTDYNLDTSTFDYVGWGVIGVVLFSIAFNLLNALIKVIMKIRDWLHSKKV